MRKWSVPAPASGRGRYRHDTHGTQAPPAPRPRRGPGRRGLVLGPPAGRRRADRGRRPPLAHRHHGGERGPRRGRGPPGGRGAERRRAASWAGPSARSSWTAAPTRRPSPARPSGSSPRERVVTVFGCWTSASRKTVKPVFERHDHLLVYPVQYEGLEESPNIVYTGAAPNQQLIPAIKWSFDRLGQRFFLVGSDYVFPRTAHAIIRDQVTALGGAVVGEAYLPLGSQDVAAVVAAIVAARPRGDPQHDQRRHQRRVLPGPPRRRHHAGHRPDHVVQLRRAGAAPAAGRRDGGRLRDAGTTSRASTGSRTAGSSSATGGGTAPTASPPTRSRPPTSGSTCGPRRWRTRAWPRSRRSGKPSSGRATTPRAASSTSSPRTSTRGRSCGSGGSARTASSTWSGPRRSRSGRCRTRSTGAAEAWTAFLDDLYRGWGGAWGGRG